MNFIFEPKSIAIIGASEKKEKVGYAVLNNIKESGYKGKVFPINPKSETILGFKTFKSVADVKEAIDLAVFCIPAEKVLNVVEECGKAGVKGAIITATGFKENGKEGAELEKKLVELIKKYNIKTVGPRSLGVISKVYNATFGSKQPKKGAVSMVSQSGAMMTILEQSGLGFSNFVTLGGKCDLDEIDMISQFGEDEFTKIIIGYLENIDDGKKFMECVPKVTEKKPVIILKSGTTKPGKEATEKHIGAVNNYSDYLYERIFKKAGIIRARKTNQLFDLANCFSKGIKPNGDKFVIITNAGGPSIVATDYFETAGVGLTKMPEHVVEALKKDLPDEAALMNPIDIIGDATPKRYAFSLRTCFKLMNDEECAGALVLVTPQSQTFPSEVAKLLLDIKKEYPSKIIFSSFMGGISMVEADSILKGTEVPNYDFPEKAIAVMKSLVEYHNQRKEIEKTKKEFEETVKKYSVEKSKVQAIIDAVRKDGRKELNEKEVKAVLDLYKIKVGEKVDAKKVNEMMIDVTNNSTFGALIKIGKGGKYAHLQNDVAYELMYKYVREDARKQLESLNYYTILKGVRGEPESAIEALMDCMMNLSQFFYQFNKDIQSLTVNPLQVFEQGKGVMCQSAKITLK